MLSTDQQKALNRLEQFINSPHEQEITLTGSPGTGKSYLIKQLFNNVDTDRKVYITATTNKATSILKDTFEEAYTIHKLLGLRVSTNYVTGKSHITRSSKSVYSATIKSLIVIDEASMINPELYDIIQELVVSVGNKVIYVGDSHQLPPVNSYPIVFLSKAIPIVELTTTHRQNEGNSIRSTCNEIKKNIIRQVRHSLNSSPNIIFHDNESAFNILDELYLSEEFRTDTNHIKALAFTNKTVDKYNDYIRRLYVVESLITGSTMDEFPSIGESVLVSNTFIPAKKVICNTEDVITIMDKSYGEYMGIKSMILTFANYKNKLCTALYTTDYKNLKRVKKELKDKYEETRSKFDYANLAAINTAFIDIKPVYASTIHKSQGSTYQNVFLDLPDIEKCNDVDNYNRLLYVAISRAKENVHIFKGD